MTTTLNPLVVFAARTYCDAPKRHEATLYTDGLYGYAITLDESTDTTDLERLEAEISTDCLHEHCDGILAWDLTACEWTANPEARRVVRDHGEALVLR